MKLLLSLLSGLLLALAFPEPGFSALAWIGLVPLFLAVDGKPRKTAFGLGFAAGVVFFAIVLFWVNWVSRIGFLALVAYQALYFGLFALGTNVFIGENDGQGARGKGQGAKIRENHPRATGTEQPSSDSVPRQARDSARGLAPRSAFRNPSLDRLGAPLGGKPLAPHSALFLIPALWVSLEFLRAHLFSGFGWALLGYSQSKNLPLIQIADLTGSWGVSFLPAMINAAVFLTARNLAASSESRTLNSELKTALVPLLILTAVLGYGFFRLRGFSKAPAGTTLTVTVVQANVPMREKWLPEMTAPVLEDYLRRSGEAVAAAEKVGRKPDLIVWPETAVTACLAGEPELTRRIREAAGRTGAHFLTGNVTFAGEEDVYNSATLVSPGTEVLPRYDKLHLVMFGEYLPLGEPLRRLGLFPEVGDFRAGKEYTIFTLPRPPVRFACLICFEDIFPELARRFKKEGAQFLVNVTNDAWFGRTGAPYQHAQASVFRAVENRLNVVRAANTGLSCFIEPTGRIKSSVRDEKGREIFVPGFRTETLSVVYRETFYGRCGDWFAWLAVAAVFLFLFRPTRPGTGDRKNE